MNHLYHTLSPLLLLASFVVLLLSFLAPVPILHERISLLRIEVNATASGVSRRWLAQSEISTSAVVSHRMLKRSVLARAANSTKKAAASAQAAATAHTLYFGPMGT